MPLVPQRHGGNVGCDGMPKCTLSRSAIDP